LRTASTAEPLVEIDQPRCPDGELTTGLFSLGFSFSAWVARTKPHAPPDDALAGVGVRRDGFDELVREALVVPLAVVVFDILREQVPEVPLAKRDHAIEAFGLHG
jgi:hypothetical protein